MVKKIEYFGYNPPFFGGHQQVLSRQSGDRIIKNDLIQLIMTYPGERLMRPDWGTLVKKAVFEPLDDTIMMTIRDNVLNAIRTWEPRISPNITLYIDSTKNTLNIKIIGRYTDIPNKTFEQELEIPLNTTLQTS